MRLFRDIWFRVFLASAAVETLSLAAFYIEDLQRPALILAGLAAVILAFRDIRYPFMMLVAETVIGSHGHLFATELGPATLSLRMVLFAVVLIAWVIHVMRGCSRIMHFPHAHVTGPLLLIIAAVAWGMLRAWGLGLPLLSAVDDANGYAFLAMVPIAVDLISDRRTFAWAGRIFVGALTWLSVKTVILLYLFTHEFPFLGILYTWQRKAWLTEITRLDLGISRVFSASHLFLLIGIFVGFFILWKKGGRRRWVWLTLLVAALLISFSRSIWLGGVVGLAFMIPVLARQRMLDRASAGRFLLRGIGVTTAAVILLLAVMTFPLPERLADGTRFASFGSRTTLSDAAVSSRWNMLDPLMAQIQKHPVFGSGFGRAITYSSDDPRIHDLYPGGVITTYAIEWQYLELWMKTGLFGLLAFIWLWWRIGRLAWTAFRSASGDDPLLVAGLMTAFLAFIIVNVFTPYLNHPIGWTFLALIIAGFHAAAEDRIENDAVHEPRTSPTIS